MEDELCDIVGAPIGVSDASTVSVVYDNNSVHTSSEPSSSRLTSSLAHQETSLTPKAVALQCPSEKTNSVYHANRTRKRNIDEAGIHDVPPKSRRNRNRSLPFEAKLPSSAINEVLCENCCKLDLGMFIRPPQLQSHSKRKGMVIADLGTRYRQPLQSGDCGLCPLLSLTRVEASSVPDVSPDRHPSDELRAFPFHPDIVWYGTWDSYTYWVLAIVPAGIAYWPLIHDRLQLEYWINGLVSCYTEPSENPSRFTPRLIPRTLDLSMCLGWLQYCQRNHEKMCGAPRSAATTVLKLINCQTRTVELASRDQPYVALSYVWGTSASNASVETSGTRLPSSLPNVIRDALTVTKALNFQYLWVDKYCIDQCNPNMKHEQIQQMDSVYANAELTIIAAAGEDETSGLPGVGSTPRAVQKCVKIENIVIVTTGCHPHKAIQTSKWATRGWTYQEAALSRRRLVFTEEQTYFECNEMYCYENQSGNLDSLHTEDTIRLRARMRPGIFGGKDSFRFGHFDVASLGQDGIFIKYWNHIKAYSARTLRYDSDSLNAFAGIMRHFEILRYPIFQLWGIPLTPSGGSEYENRSATPLTTFVDSLCWNHVNGWKSNSPPRRRSDWPSWSWAGWAGEVEYRTWNLPFKLVFTKDIMVDVEEGQLRSVRHLFRTSFSPLLSKRLYVTTRYLPSHAFGLWHETINVFSFKVEMYISSGPPTVTDLIDALRNEKVQCLLMGHDGIRDMYLVIERVAEINTRIGLMLCELWRGLDGGTYFPFNGLPQGTFQIE